jgi:hypothetical protein
LPKRGFVAITQRDVSNGVENFHILFGTRVTGSRPNFIGLFPLKPRSTKAKGHDKLAQVKNFEPAQLLRAAHGVPINFALGASCGILGGPKEGPLNLADELYGAQRDVKQIEVVDFLRGNNRLNQGGTAGRGDKLPVPSW